MRHRTLILFLGLLALTPSSQASAQKQRVRRTAGEGFLGRVASTKVGRTVGTLLGRVRLLPSSFVPKGGKTIVLYRGVGPTIKIPGAYEKAKQGIAIPGNATGRGSLSTSGHRGLGYPSRYTSWTTDIGMAQHAAAFATRNKHQLGYYADKAKTFEPSPDGKPQYVLVKRITEQEFKWLVKLRGSSNAESEVLLLDTVKADKVIENRRKLMTDVPSFRF